MYIYIVLAQWKFVFESQWEISAKEVKKCNRVNNTENLLRFETIYYTFISVWYMKNDYNNSRL